MGLEKIVIVCDLHSISATSPIAISANRTLYLVSYIIVYFLAKIHQTGVDAMLTNVGGDHIACIYGLPYWRSYICQVLDTYSTTLRITANVGHYILGFARRIAHQNVRHTPTRLPSASRRLLINRVGSPNTSHVRVYAFVHMFEIKFFAYAVSCG